MLSLKTQCQKRCSQTVDIFEDSSERDLLIRKLRSVLLLEKRIIRMVLGGVIEHVLDICDDMFVLEQIALILGILEFVKHLGYYLTLTLLDISVFVVCISTVVFFHYF